MIDAEKKVKTALLTYQVTNGKDHNAGFNIIRYFDMGYLTWNPAQVGWMFMLNPKQPMVYTVLRLAKMGQIEFTKTPKEKLKELTQ